MANSSFGTLTPGLKACLVTYLVFVDGLFAGRIEQRETNSTDEISDEPVPDSAPEEPEKPGR